MGAETTVVRLVLANVDKRAGQWAYRTAGRPSQPSSAIACVPGNAIFYGCGSKGCALLHVRAMLHVMPIF